MSSSFSKLSVEKLNSIVVDMLYPKIESILNHRSPGHCMRVADLDDDVMVLVCNELRHLHPDWNVFVLGDSKRTEYPFIITSTKLVELRNPDENGNLRRPLLVFIPAFLRTSAEDSFGVATFEELTFPTIYEDIISSLVKRIPNSLSPYILDLFQIIKNENWLFADALSRVRYLLTALENGIDGETLGASLYELMLIPDFKLFAELTSVHAKIQRNLKSVRQMLASDKSTYGRVIDIGLNDKKLEARLFDFFKKYDIQELESWTSAITLNNAWWDISFDKWVFKEELFLDNVQLRVLQTDLPTVQDDINEHQLASLIGQQVLIPTNRRKMSVSFEVNPHPNKVNGLDYFTVQIISLDAGPIGKSKKIKAWSTNRNQTTVTLANLDKIEYEEGWHLIRVLPWTASGDQIQIKADAELTHKKTYESEPFYIISDGILEETPPQRALPVEYSLEHARLRLQLIALGNGSDLEEIKLSDVSWGEKTGTKKFLQQNTLLAKFGKNGVVQIPVPSILKHMEQQILATPTHASHWRMKADGENFEFMPESDFQFSSSTRLEAFLETRRRFFSAINNQSFNLITQGTLFQNLTEECLAYANSYLELINDLMYKIDRTLEPQKQQYSEELRRVLAVDTVYVILADFRGRHREAVLVAPTHPLRALWISSWTELGNDWVKRIQSENTENLGALRSALLNDLVPFGFPVSIPMEATRIFTPIDNLNIFWGVYASTSEKNPRGLVSDLNLVLGLNETTNSNPNISGKILAEKIDRYLSQRPYIREISINVFNPGSGLIISEALFVLQQKPEYSNLRYDIRLFASDPNSPNLGDSLESLTKSEATMSEIADVFNISTGNHLFSKLNIAKHSLTEFHNNPQKYPAHISILLDVFPTERFEIVEKPLKPPSLHGIIQSFATEFIDDETGTYWSKYPIVGDIPSKNESSSTFQLLSSLSRDLCFAVSKIAAIGKSSQAVPVIKLELNLARRALIFEVHEISDWVFTIDRNMGIEFFDHGGKKNRPDYLIDYVPKTNSQSTYNLIISSRSNNELELVLKSTLRDRGISVVDEQATALFAHLRSLSGQLALKLVSSPSQQQEALGLALARLFLEYQGALRNQVIVPLDAHINLYRLSGNIEPEDEGISLQRTDLALFDLNLEERTIVCNLVEVKCYSHVGDFSAFNQLKEKITNQIYQSERILQRHFDPNHKTPDRPDRPLKSLELAQILRFYLDRSLRYGIFNQEVAHNGYTLLQSIENGYSLQFQRAALIFDFEKNGTEAPEFEVGIEFHRIGRNLIQDLINGCYKPYSESEEKEATTVTIDNLFISSVPKLETATFIAPIKTPIKVIDTSLNDENVWVDNIDYSANDDNKNQIPSSDSVQQSNQQTIRDVESDLEAIPFIQKVDSEYLVDRAEASAEYDVMLGVNSASSQYGLLGEVSGRKIGLDLNHTHTISLFGVQGGGKSYTLGSIIEMASMEISHINVLPSPLATVIFHYSSTQDYAPEFTSMIHANTIDAEIKLLKERYSASPKAMSDILILTPSNYVNERRLQYPGIAVLPIAFSAAELKAIHWRFLMGAIGNQSLYMKQINLLMRGLRDNLTLSNLKTGIETSGLSDHLKELAQTRLRFAEEYINDSQRLSELIYPGRLIIVDLRDDYIERDEALGLFVVMMQIFSEATHNNKSFNKLIVFDEAHKYVQNEELISGLVEVVREMRHKGTSIMVASQDPPSVPISLIELSTHIIMHKFNSPAWLKHIQKANAALADLTSDRMNNLGTGEAYIWSSKATDDAFTRGTVKIRCRPRVTQHGGNTKTAVS